MQETVCNTSSNISMTNCAVCSNRPHRNRITRQNSLSVEKCTNVYRSYDSCVVIINNSSLMNRGSDGHNLSQLYFSQY
jgi:hypothetical protein